MSNTTICLVDFWGLATSESQMRRQCREPDISQSLTDQTIIPETGEMAGADPLSIIRKLYVSQSVNVLLGAMQRPSHHHLVCSALISSNQPHPAPQPRFESPGLLAISDDPSSHRIMRNRNEVGKSAKVT